MQNRQNQTTQTAPCEQCRDRAVCDRIPCYYQRCPDYRTWFRRRWAEVRAIYEAGKRAQALRAMHSRKGDRP